jgi:hypothetical protein
VAEAEPEGKGDEPTPAGVAWVQGQWMVGELATLEDLIRCLVTGERAEVLASMISAARLVLVRLLREEEDSVRLTEGLKRAAEVVFKAIELEGDQAEASDSLAAASTRILTELGLGPPEAGVLSRE